MVLAKTVDDVVEEFKPIMDVLHTELSTKANDLYRKTLNLVNDFENRAKFHEYRINEQWKDLIIEINTNLDSIVNETGMTQRPDEIKHCYQQVDTDYANQNDLERSGVEVVKATTISAAQTLREVLLAIRDQQNPVHDSINSGLDVCKDQIDTPLQMQLCLINHYTLSQTDVDYLLKTMDTSIEKVKENMGAKYSIIDSAFDIIIERVKAVYNPVIDAFRKCCIAASQTRQ